MRMKHRNRLNRTRYDMINKEIKMFTIKFGLSKWKNIIMKDNISSDVQFMAL